MTRSEKEIEDILMKSLDEPYVQFTSDSPESDRQKVYRVRKRLSDEAPLLWLNEVAVRTTPELVILEWKNTARPLEISTDRPKDLEPVRTIPKPKKPQFKLPKWLETRRADFVMTQATAARLAKDDPAEYLGGWQDLDTLIIACDRLAELLESGSDDPLLEKYIRSADRNLVTAVFLGEREIEYVDPIEILRRQIAEIPVDDETREHERLKLIERREKLMLERDIRLQNVSPLD